MRRKAWRNGRLIPASRAVFPAADRAFFGGFAVYESLRVEEGEVLFPDEHIRRLFGSAAVIGIRHGLSESGCAEACAAAVRANRMRRGTLSMRLTGSEPSDFLVIAQNAPVYPEEFYAEGAPAVAYSGERLLPEAKTANLLLNILAYRAAAMAGAHEALLVDRSGRILEGTRSNVYAVEDGVLLTAGTGVLKGVTREHILRLAEEEGLRLRPEAPTLEALAAGKYSEMFISATSMGAMPLCSVDRVRFGKGHPVATRLNRLLDRLRREEIGLRKAQKNVKDKDVS